MDAKAGLDDLKMSSGLDIGVVADPFATVSRSKESNVIGGRYHIITSNHIEYPASESAIVFHVEDKRVSDISITKEMNAGYHALVFSSKTLIRFKDALALMQAEIKSLVAPVSIGVTKIEDASKFPSIDNQECIVFIMPSPKYRSLEHIIQREEEKITYDLIVSKILPVVIDVLSEMHSLRIMHGYINASNIFITEGGNVLIGECVSEICGLQQNALYDTIDRAQCHAYAKYNKDFAADYYALGVAIFYVSTRKDLSKHDHLTIIRNKLIGGTFNYFRQESSVSDAFLDLIKGLTADDRALRWGEAKLKAIIDGVETSSSSLTDQSYLSRGITFNDRVHYSTKSLAHELQQDWAQAKAFVQQDKIQKWLDISVSQQRVIDMLDALRSTMKSRTDNAKTVAGREDEWVFKTIVILDPCGPVRGVKLPYNPHAIDTLIAYSFVFHNKDIMQLVIQAISHNILSIYDQLAEVYTEYTAFMTSTAKYFSELAVKLRKQGIVFGISRFIYDLNPYMPCQSNLLDGYICLTAGDVVRTLDKKKVPLSSILVASDIPNFIGSRMKLNSDIKGERISQITSISKDIVYKFLMLFAHVEFKMEIEELPFLSEQFSSMIKDRLKVIMRGKSNKEEMFKNLDQAVKTNQLGEVLKVAVDLDMLQKDAQEYTKALNRGMQIAKELYKYNNIYEMKKLSNKKGLNLAIKISLVLSSIASIITVAGVS